jgi:hypothetical protein
VIVVRIERTETEKYVIIDMRTKDKKGRVASARVAIEADLFEVLPIATTRHMRRNQAHKLKQFVYFANMPLYKKLYLLLRSYLKTKKKPKRRTHSNDNLGPMDWG